MTASNPARAVSAARVPKLLDVVEVATLLDVSEKTIRRWISAGRLPMHRIGRLVRVSDADLAAFIADARDCKEA
jgi:excisionase family DNA binding protein